MIQKKTEFTVDIETIVRRVVVEIVKNHVEEAIASRAPEIRAKVAAVLEAELTPDKIAANVLRQLKTFRTSPFLAPTAPLGIIEEEE